jgi:hypothetical protein
VKQVQLPFMSSRCGTPWKKQLDPSSILTPHRERLRTHPHTHQPASQAEIGAQIVARPASVKATDRGLLLKQGEADVLADEAYLTVNMINRQVTDPNAGEIAAGNRSRSGLE